MTAQSDVTWERVFIENMKRLREARGMTQTDLAKALRRYGLPFHQPTVQRIENGERPVRLNEAYAMAEVFRVGLPVMVAVTTGEEPPASLPDSLAVVYVAADGTLVQLDRDDLARLDGRERALCAALVDHARARLDQAGVSPVAYHAARIPVASDDHPSEGHTTC